MCISLCQIFQSFTEKPRRAWRQFPRVPSAALRRSMFTLHVIGDFSRLIPWGLKWKMKVTQSCPTFCNHMDCSPARLLCLWNSLEWVAVPFSRGSFQSRDQTQVSCIADGFFTSWATREAHMTPPSCFEYTQDLNNYSSYSVAKRQQRGCGLKRFSIFLAILISWSNASNWWPLATY